MKKGKILLFIFWIVAISLLISININNQSTIDKFIGITTAKEHQINFSYPVELKKIFALSGKEVEKGDLLVKLIRFDLISKIEIINNKIAILESEKKIKQNTINMELQKSDNSYKLEINRVNSEIKYKRFELKRNRELLESIIHTDNNSFKNLKLEIETLENEKQSIQNSYYIKKNYLKQQLEYEYAPFQSQINSLLEEKKILNTKEDNLIVHSPINGTIGDICFSENSQIKPFDSILNIYSKYPKFVNGFIHEDIVNNLKVKQRVTIKDGDKLVYGLIESIDNRVEDIPMELRKYKLIALRGYKVVISLPENSFKLGRKVVIYTEKEKSIIEQKIYKILEFFNLK